MDAGTVLRTHRLILRLAFAAAQMFAWLFVFEYFYIIGGDISFALARVALLYALSQTVSALLTPLAARGLRHSMRREAVFGVLAAATAFIFLGATFEGFFGAVSIFAVLVFALVLGLYRALYWVPYEVERHDMPARPILLRYEVLVALMPVFAGFALELQGVHESWLLFAAGIVSVLSIVPLASVPDTYERFPWTYRETFGQLFARAHRRQFFRAVIDGIQGAALLLIWPIAVFLITGWSYALVGLIFSFSLLLVLVARGAIERAMHRLRVHDSISVRIALVSSAWIARLVIIGPLAAAIADSYLHVGNPKTSIDHATFEQVSDASHFVDEYTTLREVGLSIGRIILCCVVAVLASLFAMPLVFGTAFVLAGISAGISVLLMQTGKPTL